MMVTVMDATKLMVTVDLFVMDSYESGVLEDPSKPGPPGVYTMTVDPEKAPDKPEIIEIDFEKGRVQINAVCVSV